ncbi:MAG: adenylate/guanylate cyclase domain-containing protein [Coleofasciculaceae cyanobacterium]
MGRQDDSGTEIYSPLPEHPITVLLIDDQPMIGEAIRRMLKAEEDIIFHYCSDPTQTLKIAREVSPTVILQDLVMPDIDGLMLVRFLRSRDAPTRNVPLIVLSSKEEAKVKAEAFSLGANDYLVKLPDKLELIARIRYHSKAYINFLERNEAYLAIQNYLEELESKNELIRQIFGRYLSNEVVANLLEHPEGLKLGGERRKITILTSDLRGFTSFSERLPPEEVVKILNLYLERMADVITSYQGTIDEFMGDGILVLFGAPTQREDDAQRAIACAISMQVAMKEVNGKMRQWGLPSLEMGIGINTGVVVVGNLGSEKRTKYGVVGNQVNLTYRIESYTIGGQILASESTFKEVEESIKFDGYRQVQPKGVTQPITIYDVVGIGGIYNLFLSKEKDTFFPLPEAIPLQYTILEGKSVGENVFNGSVVKLSAKGAKIDSNHRRKDDLPPELSNIKINFLDSTQTEASEDIYAKVLDRPTENGSFYIHFTAKPPAIEVELCNLYKLISTNTSPF